MSHTRSLDRSTATRGETVLGASAIAVVCTIIAGANIPNPLAPVYVTLFELSAFTQSALFSTYLLALVATLVLLLARKGQRPPEQILLLAVGVTLLADTAMLAGSQSLPFLFLGRTLSGVGVALATGSAASVALDRLGERARTAVATSAILGSLLGNYGGGVIGAALPIPTVITYLGHAAVLVLLALPLLQRSVRTAPSAVTVTGATTTNPYRLRHRLAGYILGGTAWAVAGVILALVPGTLSKTDPSLSLSESVLPSGLFLLAAWIGQLVTRRRLPRVRAWQVLVPLLLGMGLLGAASQAQDWTWIVIASVIAGLGQGPAYSLGLTTVAHGVDPRRQGVVASIYAGIAYAWCGVVVILAGAIGTATTVPSAILAVAVACAVIAISVVTLAGAPQISRTGVSELA